MFKQINFYSGYIIIQSISFTIINLQHFFTITLFIIICNILCWHLLNEKKLTLCTQKIKSLTNYHFLLSAIFIYSSKGCSESFTRFFVYLRFVFFSAFLFAATALAAVTGYSYFSGCCIGCCTDDSVYFSLRDTDGLFSCSFINFCYTCNK